MAGVAWWVRIQTQEGRLGVLGWPTNVTVRGKSFLGAQVLEFTGRLQFSSTKAMSWQTL